MYMYTPVYMFPRVGESVFMVIMWQNNMRENEHTFRLLHVCWFFPDCLTFICMSSKSLGTPQKMRSLKIPILFVPFSALASCT